MGVSRFRDTPALGNSAHPSLERGPVMNYADFAEQATPYVLMYAELCAEFSPDYPRISATRAGILPSHPNHWGILYRSLKNRGLIREVAAQPSRTPSRNGGMNRVWSAGGRLDDYLNARAAAAY